MKTQFKHLAILFAVSFSAITVVTGRADQAAVAFDTTKVWGTDGGSGVFGWQFTTDTSIQVTALGLWCNPIPWPTEGFLQSHPVGIWDASSPQNPLVSTLIPAGASAQLINGFRYLDTSPVTLAAGHQYVIGALFPSTLDVTTGAPNNAGFVLTVSSQVHFGGYQWNSAGTLVFPDNSVPSDTFAFGPNFLFSVIPEPSTSAIGLLAAVTFFISRRIFRQRR